MKSLVYGSIVFCFGMFLTRYTHMDLSFMSSEYPRSLYSRRPVTQRMDVSDLMSRRTIRLSGKITTKVSSAIIDKLLLFESQSSAPIMLLINSKGGSVADGMAIFDVMKMISSPIITIAVGQASSLAMVLFSAGNKRLSSRNCRFMMHEISNSVPRQGYHDLELTINEMRTINDRMIDTMAELTKQSKHEIIKRVKLGDFYMSAEESVEFGVADTIVDSFADVNRYL